MPRTTARSARAKIAALTLVSALVAAPSAGAAEAVVNAGFEQPEAEVHSFTSQNDAVPVRGWDFWDPRRLIAPAGDPASGTATVLGVWHADADAYPLGAPEASNVAFLYNVAGAGAGEIGLRQRLQTRIVPGVRYELRVAVGNPRTDPNELFDVDGFPGYRIELRAGGRLLVSQQDRVKPGEGRFAQASINFRAGKRHRSLGQRLEIRLVNRNARAGVEVDFDDVRLLTTAVGAGGAAAGVIPYSGTVEGGATVEPEPAAPSDGGSTGTATAPAPGAPSGGASPGELPDDAAPPTGTTPGGAPAL